MVRLSVVVATTPPWPELAACLAALVAQVRETQSELIVADGDGQGLREDFVAAHPGDHVAQGAGRLSLPASRARRAGCQGDDHCYH